MNLIIRSATKFDAPAIAALHAASWRFAYRGALSETYLAGNIIADRDALWRQRLSSPLDQQCVLVACEPDSLLGFACVYVQQDPQWGSLLDNIHVRQDAHRQGVGAKLLLAVTNHCSQSAANSGLYLWVLQSNTAAQQFYYSYAAKNVGADIWDAPDGSSVPRFRFAWTQAQACILQQQS